MAAEKRNDRLVVVFHNTNAMPGAPSFPEVVDLKQPVVVHQPDQEK